MSFSKTTKKDDINEIKNTLIPKKVVSILLKYMFEMKSKQKRKAISNE